MQYLKLMMKLAQSGATEEGRKGPTFSDAGFMATPSANDHIILNLDTIPETT
jgi:hypothetical protein